MDNRPIGVFDSGLGGLTVVRELTMLLPHEQIVYFGDTGRVPYGSRSPVMIERFAAQDSRLLLAQDVKYIIAACGTVSSVAADVLDTLPVPAMGVVEPTATAALSATKTGKIGVLGTSLTVRSGAFERAIHRKMPSVQVFSQACPVLVTLVESGWIEPDNEATVAVVRRYLEPMIAQQIDTLILGCTHFPLLAPIISNVMGPSVSLINSGAVTAAACVQALQDKGLLAEPSADGGCRFLVSDRPHSFARVAEMFLGRTVNETVAQVNLEDWDK